MENFSLNGSSSIKTHLSSEEKQTQEQTEHSACARNLPAISWRSSSTHFSVFCLITNKREGYLSSQKQVFALSLGKFIQMLARLCLAVLDSTPPPLDASVWGLPLKQCHKPKKNAALSRQRELLLLIHLLWSIRCQTLTVEKPRQPKGRSPVPTSKKVRRTRARMSAQSRAGLDTNHRLSSKGGTNRNTGGQDNKVWTTELLF